MQEDQNQEITMINTRGRVVRVRRWEMPYCREQGMKIIVNPKQEYYPEWDNETQRYVAPTDNISENITSEDLLEIEQV